MSKKIFKISFIFILLIALFLRFYKLGRIPSSLYWDETAMFLDSKIIADTGRDMHDRPWLQAMFISYGDYKLPVYIWFASFFIKIMGVSEFTFRLTSAIAGILGVIIAALIARKLFFKKQFEKDLIFLSTMLVIALSPWSILFSRTAFEGHFGQFFLNLAVLLFLYSSKKKLFLFLSQIAAVFATYTYFSVRFVWPILFVFLIFYQNQNIFKLSQLRKKCSCQVLRKNFKKKSLFILINFLLPLSLYLILLIPMFSSPLYHESNQFRLSTKSIFNSQDWPVIANQYREIAGNSKIDRLFYNRYLLIGRELVKNYAEHLSLDYLFISGDANLRHGTTRHGLFLFPFIIPFFIGLFQLTKKHKSELLLLTLWWFLALLPASVPETTPHALRTLNALTPICLIIALGLTKLISLITSFSKRRESLPIYFSLAAYCLICLFSVFQFIRHYFIHYPVESSFAWQDAYKELALKIFEKKSTANVWVESFDDRFFLWILAYGPYNSSKIQEMLRDKYRLEQIENITFRGYDWKKISELDHKILVIGRTESINAQLEKTAIKPNWLETIQDHNHNDKFTLLEFGN
ncbi:MAG: glycosyltransferase family 39 protein [Candidatus Woesebacteria bacterium]|jgi:4-amino-4-deoxy-L-arabinose transferase-like glycosyltransferase